MTEDQLFKILPLIFIVAALYSSVGHGGASGYLAVISLFGLQVRPLTPLVLVLNILVAATSFFNFREPGSFSVKKLLPFIIPSVPAAYLGGLIRTSNTLFEVLLGIALMAAALRLIIPNDRLSISLRLQRWATYNYWAIAIPVGLILGFISGMIGIGGGIFLSPILILLGIADIKGSAALASAFIVVNSLAGLAGQVNNINSLQWHTPSALFTFIAVGLAGALAGSHWGARKARPIKLQYLLASVLLFASAKLLLMVFS